LVANASDPEVTRAFVEAAASGDRTVKVYDGLLHEVLNELPEDRARVHDDLASWVLERS